jgi:hypothetical protein
LGSDVPLASLHDHVLGASYRDCPAEPAVEQGEVGGFADARGERCADGDAARLEDGQDRP